MSSWLCHCLASRGVLSLPPHQHMRPCTCFAAFLHCPCLRERATVEPTQDRSSCPRHMLRRKHEPTSRLLRLEHQKARTWMVHMQMPIWTLKHLRHHRKLIGAWQLQASFLPLRGTKEVSGFCGGVLWSRFARGSFLTRFQWGGGVFSAFKIITLLTER